MNYKVVHFIIREKFANIKLIFIFRQAKFLYSKITFSRTSPRISSILSLIDQLKLQFDNKLL